MLWFAVSTTRPPSAPDPPAEPAPAGRCDKASHGACGAAPFVLYRPVNRLPCARVAVRRRRPRLPRSHAAMATLTTDAMLARLYPLAPPAALSGLRASPGDAVLAWLHFLADPLERGVSHVLSNRVAALDVGLEVLLDDRGAGLAPAGIDDLRGELGRLFELNATLRLLPTDGAVEEAFDLEEVVHEAVRALDCHLEFRRAHRAVEARGSAPPVRSVRWALFRALVALADGVRRAGGTGPVTFVLGGDTECAAVTVGGAGRATAPDSNLSLDDGGVPYACYLLAALGGAVRVEGPAFVLELPSLAARRARDAVRPP